MCMVLFMLSCESSSESQDFDAVSCCIESKNQFLIELGSDTVTVLHNDTCVMDVNDLDVTRNMSLIPAGTFMIGARE